MVDRFCARLFGHMADKEFQQSAFTAADAQLGYGPLDVVDIQHLGFAFGRRQDAGDDKVGTYHFIYLNVGGAGLGNVCGQLGEELFQVCRIGSHRHMRGVRVCCPAVQSLYIKTVGTDETYAVYDNALGPGRGGYRRGRRAYGGAAVGKHHHDLGVAGGRGEQLRGLGKGLGVICVASGG